MFPLFLCTVLIFVISIIVWTFWPRIQLQTKVWSVKRITWSYEGWDKYQESPRNFAAFDDKGNVLFIALANYSSWWDVSSRHHAPQWVTESLRALVEKEQKRLPDPAFPQSVLEAVVREST